MKTQDGFSLLELLVVLVILSILLAMSNPIYLKFRKTNDLNESADKLIALLNQSRSDAIIRNQNIKVQLKATTNTETNTVYWKPVGKVKLLSSSNDFIVFDGQGNVVDALNGGSPVNANYILCDDVQAKATISRRIGIGYLGSINDSDVKEGCQ